MPPSRPGLEPPHPTTPAATLVVTGLLALVAFALVAWLMPGGY